MISNTRTAGSRSITFVAGEDLRRPPAFFGSFQFGRSRMGDTKGGRDIAATGGRADIYAACAEVLRTYVALYPQHFAGCDLSDL